MSDDYEGLMEQLSSLEHVQWINWSQSVAESIERLIELIDMDKLSQEDKEFVESQKDRLKRWESYWVSYDELEESVKEQDREYARKTIDILKKNK